MSAMNTALLCAGLLPTATPRSRKMSTTTRLALMCAGAIPLPTASQPAPPDEKPVRNPIQAQILAALHREGGRATHRELLEALGCTKNSLYIALARMRTKGLVRLRNDGGVRYNEVAK